MRWEDLTSKDFEKAVRKSKGVCILPVSCLEKHGDHLPLGTDMLWGKAIADAAAEMEPAIVFPPHFLGQINCGRHLPGAVALRHGLLMDLLENVCDEIARNGLKKIVIYNSHGGNDNFLLFFAQALLEKERDYVVYVHRVCDKCLVGDPEWRKLVESGIDGHGGEAETSLMLGVDPELVKMKELSSKESGMPLKRLKHLPPSFTPIWWYADYPNHYEGEGKFGSEAKGERLVELESRRLAVLIKAVKADRETPELTMEFYKRTHKPPNG